MRSSWAHSRSCWRNVPLVTVTVRDWNFLGHVSQRRRRLLWSGSSLNCFHSSFHSWGHSAIGCGLLEGPAGNGCESGLGWLASSVMSDALRLPASCARLSSSIAVSRRGAPSGALATLGEAIGGASMQRTTLSLMPGAAVGGASMQGSTLPLMDVTSPWGASMQRGVTPALLPEIAGGGGGGVSGSSSLGALASGSSGRRAAMEGTMTSGRWAIS